MERIDSDVFLGSLGKVVRDRREYLGLSQEALAQRSSLHRTYISELERGGCNATIKSLMQLASALDMTFLSLVQAATDAQPKDDNEVDILLVEDNRADVHMINMAFQKSGHAPKLHVSEDGADALAYLTRQGKYSKARRPRLIILDLNLPKTNGMELLSQIKADDKLRKIPVVILTTSSNEDDVSKSYGLNASCYVTKPADPDRFFKVIANINDFWLASAALPKA